MSTEYGYVCLDHNPEIVSEYWFNWGDDLLKDTAVQYRTRGWPMDPILETPFPVSDGYITTDAPLRFLAQHPHCRIGVRSEYGRTPWEIAINGAAWHPQPDRNQG